MSRKSGKTSTVDSQGRIITPPEIVTIAVDKLLPYRNHMFDTYEGERLDKLADSIDTIGLQNPIIVRPVAEGNYEILSGHNRVKAIKLLGWNVIPAIDKGNLTDEAAEQIVIESNLNQQSFSDWKYSQQIRVIKMYSKFIKENSQQGKRNDLTDDDTSVHGGQKLSDEIKPEPKPKRLSARDKISKQLGISSSVFERYRSVAKLDDETVVLIGEMLDEKRMGFMSAYRLSQLKPNEIATVAKLLEANPDVKLSGKAVQRLSVRSKESESDLTNEAIGETLLSENTDS